MLSMRIGVVAVTLFAVGVRAQCSGSHSYNACGRCWTDAAQAQQGGCNQNGSPPSSQPPPPPPPPNNGPGPAPSRGGLAKFEPASGRLLIIGQDTGSIDQYIGNVGRVPAGVTGYTSVDGLEGLTSNADYGTGNHNLQYLANKYPNSALALGVYVVGQLDAINNGGLEGNLRTLIDTLAGMNRQVFLRFGYEADGSWNSYDPGAFKAAWVKAYNMVQSRGAGNKIAMVWQLATYCSGTFGGHPFDAWWPGAQYVDWIGISTFTQYDCNWGPQNQLLSFARSQGKPVMIAESANQGYDNDAMTWRSPQDQQGGTTRGVSQEEVWNSWFAPWFQWIEQNADVVKAVAYISADWDSQSNWNGAVGYQNGYWGDTRVTVNSYIRQRWLAEVGKSSWIHAGGAAPPPSTPPPTSPPAPVPQPPAPVPQPPAPVPQPPASSGCGNCGGTYPYRCSDTGNCYASAGCSGHCGNLCTKCGASPPPPAPVPQPPAPVPQPPAPVPQPPPPPAGNGRCGNCHGTYPYYCPNGNCYTESSCSGHCGKCRSVQDPCKL